ncbi:MAG: hypothetical protein HY907_01110 [Deltaproteobacteria bacterium]|nr:hypothetical protein [Deltaproteobacteria bacterium]
MTGFDPHRLAEERSLELHRRVAAELARDGAIVSRAAERVVAWRASGALHGEYAELWMGLLRGPRGELLRVLVDESEAGRRLRQTSPFSFVVSPRERWGLWREVRERLESGAT